MCKKIIIFSFCSLVLFISCSKKTNKINNTYKVFSETFENTIEISGNIEAAEEQVLSVGADGFIQDVYFKEGDVVKKGQTILKMEDLQQQYDIANMELQLAQKRLSASPKEIELSKMQLQLKKNELEKKKSIARFDGILVQLKVAKGDYVEAGNKVATIIDREYLKATVEVVETDVPKLKVNQKVMFTFPAYPKQIEGYVSYVPSVGIVSSRGSSVVEAEIRIDNPPEEILIGYSFTGTIQISEPVKYILADKKVIHREKERTYVKKLQKDGSVVEVQVETEPYNMDFVKFVNSDIKEGDVLLEKEGNYKSGQKKDSFKDTDKKNSKNNNSKGMAPIGVQMPRGRM